jgi:Ni,Fe-hydrogenase maturation factor
VHHVGVADPLDAARLIGCYPESVVLLGVAPGSIRFGFECTQAVEAAIGKLVSAVVREVASLGYELVAQPRARAADRPVHALVRHFGL